MDWSGLTGFLQRLFGFNPDSPLLFTQFYFWAFFAVVYAFFALIGDRRLLRNAFLFFVSLFFYYKTSGLSVLILIFVTCSDFMIARRIAASSRPGRKRAWLVLSVCIDLLLLCYFKYAYFFADFVHSLTGLELKVVNVFGVLGNMLSGAELFRVDRIVLPVGISFFTFQIISYTVDVYRGKVKPVTISWISASTSASSRSWWRARSCGRATSCRSCTGSSSWAASSSASRCSGS